MNVSETHGFKQPFTVDPREYFPAGIEENLVYQAAPELFSSPINAHDATGMHDGSQFLQIARERGLALRVSSVRDLRRYPVVITQVVNAEVGDNEIYILTAHGDDFTLGIERYRFNEFAVESPIGPNDSWGVFAQSSDISIILYMELGLAKPTKESS